MKIRIKDNSIRLRLSQNEVSQLVSNGSVESSCKIGSSVLRYGVKSTTGEEISSDFADTTIIVRVPQSLLTDWDTDQRVGFDKRKDDLYILIEKDWQCLKPRDHEDESNLYRHPAS
mgnify:FL=1